MIASNSIISKHSLYAKYNAATLIPVSTFPYAVL